MPYCDHHGCPNEAIGRFSIFDLCREHAPPMPVLVPPETDSDAEAFVQFFHVIEDRAGWGRFSTLAEAVERIKVDNPEMMTRLRRFVGMGDR